MERRQLAAACLAAAMSTNIAAECSIPPDASRWLVKVEHRSTYPAGPEWNTTITVHDDGCLVMDAPKALREGGGRTEQDIPQAHLDGLKAFVASEKLYDINANLLIGEMKSAGFTDLDRLGAGSVMDAPYTVVSFRDSASKAQSQPVEIYALSSLELPKSMSRLAGLQEMVRTIDRIALTASLSRSTVDVDATGREEVR